MCPQIAEAVLIDFREHGRHPNGMQNPPRMAPRPSVSKRPAKLRDRLREFQGPTLRIPGSALTFSVRRFICSARCSRWEEYGMRFWFSIRFTFQLDRLFTAFFAFSTPFRPVRPLAPERIEI